VLGTYTISPKVQPQTFAALKAALSADRLETYRPANGTDEDTICCHLWNLALCESLLPMLQTLEIVFRNTIHHAIGQALSSPQWILNGPPFLGDLERAAIEEARQSLQQVRKPVTEPRMVAELRFGFWTSLADRRYDRLWPRIIRTAFPAMPNSIRTRNEISARINGVRRLRNAVFHHHSIWHWADLRQQHEDGYTVIGWIAPDMAMLIRRIDRFSSVHDAGASAFQSNLPA
jgi:hypothetical protein